MSPTNLLILTNHNRLHNNDHCLIENFLIDEKLKVIKKSSVRKLNPKFILDRPEQFKKYCKYLTFDLEYKVSNDDLTDLKGILKIRKDPKPE